MEDFRRFLVCAAGQPHLCIYIFSFVIGGAFLTFLIFAFDFVRAALVRRSEIFYHQEVQLIELKFL